MSAEMMDDLPTPSSPISATRISRGAISLSQSECLALKALGPTTRGGEGSGSSRLFCAEAIANFSLIACLSLSLSLSRLTRRREIHDAAGRQAQE